MYVVNPANQLVQVRHLVASESLSIPNPAPGNLPDLRHPFASPNHQATKASVDSAVLAPNVGTPP